MNVYKTIFFSVCTILSNVPSKVDWIEHQPVQPKLWVQNSSSSPVVNLVPTPPRGHSLIARLVKATSRTDLLVCLLKNPSGTTIKDTWTKSRGRVDVGEGGGFVWGEVEGWGEKAHNCNWITIKNFLKKESLRLQGSTHLFSSNLLWPLKGTCINMTPKQPQRIWF